MDDVENFFCPFPNPWALRVSGMGGYTSKCEKSQNHCTLMCNVGHFAPESFDFPGVNSGEKTPCIAKTQYRKLETNIPKKYCTASVPISTLMCLWAIYIILWSVGLFCYSNMCGLILGIFKSFTDTWMWKLWLRWVAQFLFWEYINRIFLAVWGISGLCNFNHDCLK